MDLALKLPEETLIKEEIKKEIEPTPQEKKDLNETAVKYAKQLVAIDLDDMEKKQNSVNAVYSMGLDIQKASVGKSALLQIPLKDLSKTGSEGSKVSNTLVELRDTVKDLDPSNVDFAGKGFLGFFSPIKKYFGKFEKSESILDGILKSLDNGSDVLKRDNISLQQEQVEMRELTKKLDKIIIMGQDIDKALEVEAEAELDPNKKAFITDELLFPLRQRIMDLQQQLAVNQQGILAMEVLIRNNKELIRGVQRAKLVTVNALKIAIIVAKALSDQKLVLDQINALNETTNNLIVATSERLKTQGVEIQKQAASSALDVDKLKQAFTNINEAMDEIAKFKAEALPKMAQTIDEFTSLTNEGEEKIKRLEKGNMATISNI